MTKLITLEQMNSLVKWYNKNINDTVLKNNNLYVDSKTDYPIVCINNEKKLYACYKWIFNKYIENAM